MTSLSLTINSLSLLKLGCFNNLKINVLLKPNVLALMGAASFYGGVHHKRYSGQQEIAPENYPSTLFRMTIV